MTLYLYISPKTTWRCSRLCCPPLLLIVPPPHGNPTSLTCTLGGRWQSSSSMQQWSWQFQLPVHLWSLSIGRWCRPCPHPCPVPQGIDAPKGSDPQTHPPEAVSWFRGELSCLYQLVHPQITFMTRQTKNIHGRKYWINIQNYYYKTASVLPDKISSTFPLMISLTVISLVSSPLSQSRESTSLLNHSFWSSTALRFWQFFMFSSTCREKFGCMQCGEHQETFNAVPL